MIMKNYVADELSNKVYHLYKALNQAEKIIDLLEEENKNLKVMIQSIEANTPPEQEYLSRI